MKYAWTFEVGESEKHSVRVEVSSVTGRTKVFVDGQQVLSKFKAYSIGDSTERFTVGVNEVHRVTLNLGRTLVPDATLSVDDGPAVSPLRGPPALKLPLKLRVLKSVLLLLGLLVLLGGVEGELFWAAEGITFTDLITRLLLVLITGVAIATASSQVEPIYVRRMQPQQV